MPIPGSVLNNLINLKQLPDTIYPSLCTFLKPTVSTDTTGQDIRTFGAVDASHTNVRCRKSPLILIRPQNQERPNSGDFTTSQENFQLSLDVYFSDLLDTWQVVVDGATYQVLAVERDGNLQANRLELGNIQPFNSQGG